MSIDALGIQSFLVVQEVMKIDNIRRSCIRCEVAPRQSSMSDYLQVMPSVKNIKIHTTPCSNAEKVRTASPPEDELHVCERADKVFRPLITFRRDSASFLLLSSIASCNSSSSSPSSSCSGEALGVGIRRLLTLTAELMFRSGVRPNRQRRGAPAWSVLAFASLSRRSRQLRESQQCHIHYSSPDRMPCY